MKNFWGKLKSISSKRILYFDYARLISTKIMNVFQMRIVFKFQIITISYRFYGRKQFNIKNKVYQFIDFEDLQILTTNERNLWSIVKHGNPIQGRKGPEQGFPCVELLTGKNLFSLQGTPLLIAGILYSLQGFPCENYYTGRSLQSVQGMGLQCGWLMYSRVGNRCIAAMFINFGKF